MIDGEYVSTGPWTASVQWGDGHLYTCHTPVLAVALHAAFRPEGKRRHTHWWGTKRSPVRRRVFDAHGVMVFEAFMPFPLVPPACLEMTMEVARVMVDECGLSTETVRDLECVGIELAACQ